MEVFTHNIRWLRKKHGLSKRKMAELLGIGLWSLNRLERGQIPPRMTIEILFAVQKHFGISPAAQLESRLGD